MPLFDDISRKITQAGQSIEQKTKDVASLTKISSALSAEEKNLDRIYIQIGKLYSEKYAECPAHEFDELLAAVKRSSQAIAELRRQAQEIKGLRTCEKCGGEVPIAAGFCNHCGAQMPKPPTPAGAVVCVRCGAAMQPGVKFCTSCGNPMPAPSEPVVEPIENRCPQCGATLVEGATFCTNCGSSVVSEQFEEIASTSQPAVEPIENRCPQCGTTLVEGATFCTECGTKLF